MPKKNVKNIFLGEPMEQTYSASEAARRAGVSIPTLKELCRSGRLASFRTPGGHLRIPADALAHLGHEKSVSIPAGSTALGIHRERLDEKKLEIDELRLDNEREKLLADKKAREKEQRAASLAASLRSQARLEEARLQNQKNAQQQDRERRQREREQWKRRWVIGAEDEFPDWLLEEQRQGLREAVDRELEMWEVDDSEVAIGKALDRIIKCLVEPWQADREALAKRDTLIERIVWELPRGATEADKARAAASVRVALSNVPIGAGNEQVRVAFDEALAPVKESMKKAQTVARREQLIEFAGRSMWNCAEADKAEAMAAVRSALSNLSLGASQYEEQLAVDAAVAPIKKAAEEQGRRERKKSTLITIALSHALTYLDDLYNDKKIELDPGEDIADVWRDVEPVIRKRLTEELTGDEPQDEANAIAGEALDRCLG
jgi:excisionase family DNA binding protein